VQLKQAVLDELFAQERRQISEFERLIIGAKQSEKQAAALIKQAQEAVFLQGKSASRTSVKVALNVAFDKLAYLDKVLTFENQKQQFCTFTTPEEMEIFIAEVVAN